MKQQIKAALARHIGNVDEVWDGAMISSWPATA